MGFIIKILVTALAVFVADYFLDGVHINDDAKTVIIVALVLALLNAIVKPILVILTIPITLITLGLFLRKRLAPPQLPLTANAPSSAASSRGSAHCADSDPP